jgi:hypothetical protein
MVRNKEIQESKGKDKDIPVLNEVLRCYEEVSLI